MSGNDEDTMEWNVHASGDTTPVGFSEDGRIPVYLSKTGKYFTIFGDTKRPWIGAEPTILQNGDVGDFNDFTLRGEKESWWMNRFDFQNASDDVINKTYRKSLTLFT